MSTISKFLAGLGINSTVGMPVVGIGALFYSPNIGGYQDPNFIDGYRFNPDDGKWYLIPPAPDLGQFAWEEPANNQSELTEIRMLRIWHNNIEKLSPGDGNIDRTLPSQIINDLFNSAKRWTWPRDPIILDLDGNGLETVGLASNIHFDHNGDGVMTKTGWVGKDDALLVWDRNGNGSIDTGAELFGDFTPLPNGTLAPNGFAALAALDSNGDGIIDASDPAFAELKLWRDADQNGITGQGELISLQDAGIVSLNLANTLKNQSLTNGNPIRCAYRMLPTQRGASFA
jgi:hypothetical protein